MYEKTHSCVLYVACSQENCLAPIGEMCRGPMGPSLLTHGIRRYAYAALSRRGRIRRPQRRNPDFDLRQLQHQYHSDPYDEQVAGRYLEP